MTAKSGIKTRIFRFDSTFSKGNAEERHIQEAAAVLKNGGLVAFPTETVYGLGADIYQPESVKRIFLVKGRPGDNPLIVHLSMVQQVSQVAEEIPDSFWILAKRFLPGPLTVVLPKKDSVSPLVSAGLSTVAIRVPAHPVAARFLQEAKTPVAAPSANLSGRPSPTRGAHVIEDLQGKVEIILDAGPTGVGVESTVLDLTGQAPRILRPGGVTLEMLRETLGGSVEAPDVIHSDRPLAPGMKYRHYAPEAPLCLLSGEPAAVDGELCKRLSDPEFVSGKKKVAVLAFTENKIRNQVSAGNIFFYSLGSRKCPEEAAQTLFQLLRLCDREQMDQIYAVAPPRTGVGEAVYNRLLKAAGGNVVEI